MNKQKLAAKIWESANNMRSKIEANDYKDYILGFIFYKYLSDYELNFLKKEEFPPEAIQALSEEDTEKVEYIKSNIGYFIAYKDLFSTWIAMGRDFDVSSRPCGLVRLQPLHQSGPQKAVRRDIQHLGDRFK